MFQMFGYAIALGWCVLTSSAVEQGDIADPLTHARHVEDGRQSDLTPNSAFKLLVWGQVTSSSTWLMVELRTRLTSHSKVLVNTTRGDSPAECAFALTAHDQVAFMNGLNITTYNLTNGKLLGSEELKDSALETFDYNPNSGRFEGISQLWRPEQNMSERCWCYIDNDDHEVKYVFQMPTEFYGDARSSCVSYLNGAHNSFWYPTDDFSGAKWLVSLDASSQDPSDAQWFGAINGSDSGDAYVHDYTTNKTYAVQPSSNTSTQLVEVIRGVEPYLKNNSMPKWIADFPPGYRLSADGLMAYDEASMELFLIMHHVDSSDGQHFLVTVNVNSTAAFQFQPITWPVENFQPNSVKIW